MNKTHMTRRGHAVRAVMSIAAAAALAGALAVQPAAAQTQASSDLRTSLTASLAEHTLLAGNATAAILGNRPAEAQAAQATLNQNASKIAGLIGNLYGGNASSAFLPLWQRHIQYYADYANALKAGDANGRQQAASNLMQWSADMGALLSSPAQFSGTASQGNAGSNPANMNMSGNAGVTQMMQQHVMDSMQVIDAQSANNWAKAYSLATGDVRHMKNVAENLLSMHSKAAAYQGANADLKANLAMLLVENAALNANATSAMLNNRMQEYQAASAALQANTAAMSGVLGTVYGGNTYNNVNSVWTDQSLKLAQYAHALANQDVATQEAARANVRGFTSDFVTQFNQSNAQLPAAQINGWGGVLTTNAINLIDAQRAQNYAREYQLRAQTDQYLLQLPEFIGQSVSQQFPNQYGMPSSPSVPANVGSVNDNTSVASSNNAGSGSTAAANTGSDNRAAMSGTSTTAGNTTGAGNTAGTTNAAGDASTAGAGTVLLPTTGSDLSSSVGQVTGTMTTTDTTGTAASTSMTGTTGMTDTTTTGASSSVTGTTGTTTSTTTSGSVLLPQTGADLSSSAYQVTGTTTTTDTTGTGASSSVTSTTGMTDTTTTGASSSVTGTTGTTTSTTTSGSVLLPQTGADLSSSAYQVTGTTTTTGTTGTGASPIVTSTSGTTNTTTPGTSATVTDTSTTSSSSVLLPQTGDDRSQQGQQVTPNTVLPVVLVIAGVALVMAVLLMSFAARDYGRQKRDE